MSRLEGLLLVLGDAVVGGGDSDVGLLAAQSKLVVAVGQILAGDLNALDGDEQRLLADQSLVVQCLCIGENVGVVDGLNRLDGLVEDLDGGVYDLVKAVVGILQAAGLDRHTDLQTKICLGILGVDQTVNVVAALVIKVLDVDTVAAGAVGLGEDTRDDTLNDDGRVILSGCVLGVREHLVCGNGALKRLHDRVTLVVLDGGGELVVDVGLGLFVDVDGHEAGLFTLLDGDTLGHVNGPVDRVNGRADHHAACDVVVGGSLDGLVLVKAVQIIACGDQLLTGALIARRKGGQAHSQEQQNGNYLFHSFLFSFF